MKSLTLFASMTLIILVCSCKKNNDNQTPENPASALIKSMIFTDTTGKYIASSMPFQYDSQDKVMQMIFDNPPDIDSLIYKYEYYPSIVIEKIFNRNNDKWGRNTYYLNSDGLATSEIDMGYNQNGDSSVGQNVTYKYNTDGYMIEKKSYLYGDTATWMSLNWQIQNGNIASMTLSLSVWRGGSVTETYEYIPNSVNTLGNKNDGKMFLGKSNANLIKSSLTNNTIPKSGTYTYTFDSMNRVIQEFIRGDGLMTSTVNLTFTYY